MSLTQQQIEDITDRLRSLGFDMSEVSNDSISIIVGTILESLGIDFQN